MNSPIFGLRVAGTVFALVCIAQMIRLLTHTEVLVNDYALPLWPSAFAFIIAGGLSLWMWQLSRRVTR